MTEAREMQDFTHYSWIYWDANNRASNVNLAILDANIELNKRSIIPESLMNIRVSSMYYNVNQALRKFQK